jgi:MFS family permease
MKISYIYIPLIIVILVRASNASFILSTTLTLPHVSPEFHSIILASYSIAEATTGIFTGIIYEYIGSKRLLTFSTLGESISYGLMTLLRDPYVILILNAFSGFLASSIIVSTISLISESLSGGTRILGMGGFESVNLGGYLIGFLTSGIILLFKEVSYLISFVFMFSAFIMSLLLKVNERRKTEIRLSLSEFKSTSILLPIWIGFAMILGFAFVLPKLFTVLNIRLTIGNIDSVNPRGGVTIFILVAIIIVMIAAIIGGFITRFIGKKYALIIGSISTALLLISSSIFLNNPIALLVILAILIFPSLSLPTSLLSLLADFTDKTSVRGPYIGVYTIALGVGIALGQLLGGTLFQKYGIQSVFQLLSALFITLAIISILLIRKNINN